ncbi:hypothetical protein FMUND_7722 [Fusarium mundagurra]|uniref:Uncharacterized protein n=1 Tax=Fusarium mundagurra TaxID=1567541 RepID=A0A8H6DDV2_9HYPO|nr:hypothetical protein FMUND_7722 [Fusarium mundagurra]
MGLIQDEDGDVSIDLAVVFGMQNEIWALYISSADLPNLGEPRRHSVARKDDDIIVQEESRVDLGIVEDDPRRAVLF